MRRAFTLIDNLITIGIGAILLAAMLPFLFRARENAGRSECQSHLKQISLSVRQYAQDYDGRFPMVQSAKSEGWAESLYAHTKSHSIFQCSKNKKRCGEDIKLTDYFYNSQLSGLEEKKVRVPASTILLGDGNFDAPLNTAIASLPHGWRNYYKSPSYRHGYGANYAFADGHVKWFAAEKITLKKPNKSGEYTFLTR